MTESVPNMPMWNEKHLRAATRAAGIALWSWNVDTDAITMDDHAYDLWEVSKDEREITFEILSRNIHPADLARVRSAFAATRAVIGAYEIDFRILSGSDIRWISARGQGDDADIADRIMFGVFLDVTQRKQAEEANELLAGEMNLLRRTRLISRSAQATCVGFQFAVPHAVGMRAFVFRYCDQSAYYYAHIAAFGDRR